ncbi:hypothetical protein ONZ45_g12845 [Pleurotus djamor]|nr:hypothetical protein ONZ45_g12845 [Pleurotus djamor]
MRLSKRNLVQKVEGIRVNIAPTNLTLLRGDRRNGDFSGFVLKMCDDIPHGQQPDPCSVLFKDGDFDSTHPSEFIAMTTSDIYEIRPATDLQNRVNGVDIFPPHNELNNARREDLTFIFLQFWFFGVTLAAILYDSIPHTLAILLARVLVTGWSAYAIWRTGHNKHVFDALFIGENTPCRIDLWPEYFSSRIAAEIPDLILNVIALCISSYLSWTLVKRYNQQSFKCMGPPPSIVRIYRFFMAVLVCLHLATFFLVVAMSLWTDQMFNTAIGRTSEHIPVYQALVIGTTVLLLPWISLGWYAVRHERKPIMVVFLLIAFVFLGGWSAMFYSIVYRWSLQEWPFLLSMTTFAFVVIFASVVLGIVCWLNFNKGLAQYLHAESVLASSNFVPSVFKHDPETASQLSDLKVPTEAGLTVTQPAQDDADAHPLPTYYLPTLPSYDSNAPTSLQRKS